MPVRLHLASLLIRDTLLDLPEAIHAELSEMAHRLEVQSMYATAKLGSRGRFARYDNHLMTRIIEISRGLESDEIYTKSVRRSAD